MYKVEINILDGSLVHCKDVTDEEFTILKNWYLVADLGNIAYFQLGNSEICFRKCNVLAIKRYK